MYINIEEVAKLVGVSSSSIRLWEKQGRLPKARTTFGGHRRYTLEEVEKIKALMENANDL